MYPSQSESFLFQGIRAGLSRETASQRFRTFLEILRIGQGFDHPRSGLPPLGSDYHTRPASS